jgi:quinoprotein relay system zinc metallohydrolase 2
VTGRCGGRDGVADPGVTPAHTLRTHLMKCTDTRLLTRRQAVLGLLGAGVSMRPRAAAPGRLSRAAFVEVSRGLFVSSGRDEDANAANGGAIANIGFIIGKDSVATLDAGGSLEDGETLRAAIRARTRLPIRYVILSHVHPDHVFGASAFLEDKPEFVGHARLPNALALRGDYYRARLESELGKGRAGAVVAPTMLVEGTRNIDLGGRVLRLTAHPTAHTDNDLSVVDTETGTLLVSDLLFVRRVPSLDGSLRGWLRELQGLKSIRAARAVPGHGPASVDWPSSAAPLERYLNTLLTETRAVIARGVTIEEAVNVVGQAERGKWALFDDYHGRNVTQAYKELEWE